MSGTNSIPFLQKVQIHVASPLLTPSSAAKVPTKRRGTSIKPTVENLAAECYDKGILPDSLRELIDLIISPSHLDQASLNNLIRNLYPATSIDDDILIKIVGGLGHGALKPSLVVQAALIRWMILTHHIFKVQNALSKVYGVLFNLLDTAAIRFVSNSCSSQRCF